VPLALAGLIGNPLDGWSDLKAGDLSDAVVIDILAGIAWLAWAQFALATVIEAFSLATRADSPGRVPGVFAGQQQLARALIAAIFILTPTVVGVVAPVASFASAPAPATVSASQQADPVRTSGQPARPLAPTQAARTESARPVTHEYVVPASGGPSTYWDLAEHYLGRGDQWRQIWQLNEGRQQADGSRMLAPGLLRPGWTVLVPAHTHTEIEQIQVRPGDTLSGIAETAGQPDWQQAWQASADRAEPGGRQFTDPNLILPGWTVEVPVPVADDTTVAAVRPALDQPPISRAPSVEQPPPVRPAPNTSIATTQSSASGFVQVLEGGGALLAAGLLAALGSRRRRQFRHRRPGRAIATAPLSMLDVERAVLATGPAGQADVAFLDRALRSLAQQVGAAGLPDLAAVRIVADQLDLRLTEPYPSSPPAPWQVDETGYWWSVSLVDPLPLTGRPVAPYPTLVTIGTGPEGDRWLLDLERAGAVSLVGTEQISTGLARFVVAELALNGWSDHLNVTMVGFGAELVGLNPQRLGVAADLGRLVDQLTATVAATDPDLLGTRLADDRIGLTPQVILIDPAAVTDDEALQRLLFAVRTQPDRSTVSVVLLADTTHTHQTRYQLELDPTGGLQLAAFGLELQAQQLSAEQATAFADLVGSSDDLTDRATPIPRRAGGWTDWTDQAGLLRPDLLRPAPPAPASNGVTGIRLSAVGPPADTEPETTSLLPEPDTHYLEQAATTAEDIALLAPDVPRQLGAQLDDPALDADLAEWFADTPVRPRLAVLGPIRVDTAGNQGAVAGRLDYYRELVARLALVENPEQLLGNTGNADQARTIAMLSSWLGADPATGQAFLRQDALTDSAVLTDADLFRRLRLRGQARGARGLPDLVRALELVRGEPFGQRRIGGYGWLADSQLEHIYRGMVVDVAHLVATRALAEQDPVTARQAATTGLIAAPDDDVPLLDLVAVCTMQGLIEERERHVRAILRKHDAEVEEDLPPRTAQILRRRGWAAAS
jgi:hypothetical protein